MKKGLKEMAIVLLTLGVMVGCGGGSTTSTNNGEPTLSGKATNGGKVLNIRCWNDEFQRRFRAYSTDYVKTNSDGSDLLRDGTKVVWNIVPSEQNAYQIALDEALKLQDTAAADDKVDMFLAEADYILKYADTDYSLDVQKDIGLTDNDIADQYKYTQEIATSNGVLKGISWQAAPGLFAYRRDIAKAVFGFDDPDKVQAKISDWTKFDETAKLMKDKNYYMLSGYDDSYRTFSNNMSQPWVKDGTVSIDPIMKQWVDQTKTYTDKGYSHKTQLWKSDWQADQGPSGAGVFGWFYSTWGINFTLLENSKTDKNKPGWITNEDGSKTRNGLYGEYGVVEGPASYYWGGSWLMPCKGTDNQAQIKRIMQDICCSKAISERFTRDTEDYTNNKTAMHKLATDPDYGSEFLNGQNHIALFEKSAEKISMKNMTPYDQGCNEQFQEAMHDYFAGTVTYEQALANFKTKLSTKYSDLKYNF